MIKKFLLSVGLVGLVTLSVSGASSTTFTLAAATFTNASNPTTGISAPVKVSQVIVSSAANNTATLQFIDCPTNIVTFTNAAYSNIVSYVTNYISTYVNFYGATNSITNKTLVDITNSVAATSFAYNTEFIVTVPTNSTVTFNNLAAQFNFGLGVTNTAGGAATVTVNYTQ